MKILISGADGQLGKALEAGSRNYPEHDYLFTDLEQMDVSNYDEVERTVLSFEPEVLINCASYNAVDKAEDEPMEALRINGKAVQGIAGLAKKYSFCLVHISTDYIFDGKKGTAYTEMDEPHPQSKYAHSKYIGEQAVFTAAPKAVIIRTSWLYSEHGHNFVKTIRKLAVDHEELRVVNDQSGSPTYAPDLAEVIFRIIPSISSYKGVRVYNYSNEGLTNWAEFAESIIEYSGLKCRVRHVTTDEYGLSRATRPSYSLLDNTKIKTEFDLNIPDWKDSLKKCINNLEKEKQA